jgi:uncharacterized membrane protein
MKRNLAVIGILTIALGTGAAFAAGGKERMSFEDLDQNGDGQLTQSELEARGAERFASVDTNNDGKLSEDELTAQGRSKAQERAQRMIERLDSDGDGALSQAELDERPNRGRIFARIDANDDGTISKEEFEDGRKNMRNRMKQRHSN